MSPGFKLFLSVQNIPLLVKNMRMCFKSAVTLIYLLWRGEHYVTTATVGRGINKQ